MLKDAKRIISEYVLPSDKIAVAVSGGADSVCLLHFVLECGVKNENICVVNFNHNIRGEEADRDSRFVEKLCRDLCVKLCYFSADIPALAKKSGESVETQARIWRYGVFEQLIVENDLRFILTAHHQDDDVETILMHLFRGSGIGGLCGMKELSRGHYLRPLINTGRAQIEQYLAVKDIGFVTDSTNFNSDYTRNFVRNELLPLIKSRYSGVNSAIISLKNEARVVVEDLDSRIDRKLICEKNDGVYLQIEALREKIIAPRYIMRVFAILGIRADYSRININEILNLAKKRNGAKTELFGITVFKEYEKLFFTRDVEVKTDVEGILFAEGLINLGGKQLFITSDYARVEGLFTNDIEKDRARVLYFDLSKIPSSTVIRFRRNGDVFKPFAGKTKKLKDYLIDKKIPQRFRNDIPLIAVENEVLAVVGVEVSDLIRLDEAGKKCYVVGLEKSVETV